MEGKSMEHRVVTADLQMVFNEQGNVTQIINRASGYDHIHCPVSPDGIWLLNLIRPVVYQDPVPELSVPNLVYEGHEWWVNRHEHLADLSIDSNTVGKPVVTSTAHGLTLAWELALPEQQLGHFTLHVEQNVEDNGVVFRAEISVPDKWAIKKVDFPRIRGIGDVSNPEQDSVLLPFNWGILRKNPLETMVNLSGQYPSTFNSVQMTAFFHHNNGLYLGILDPDSHNTGVSIQYVEGDHPTPYMTDRWHTPDDKAPWQKREEHSSLAERIKQGLHPSICLQCHHWPEMLSQWRSSYCVKLQGFSGDWFDAAQIHKKWGRKQHWCRHGRLSERKDRSDLLLQTDLWFNQYGFHPGSFEPKPAWEFQKEIHRLHDFFKMPFGVHWYNWHNFSWHSQYPNHQPPVEGFEEVARELQSRGIVLMPYCQGRLLYRDRATFDEDRTHANLETNGQPYFEKYTSGDDWPLALCPGDVWSRQQWYDAAEMLWRKYGMQGVYFDQISAMPPSLCYHKGHGHRMGGGNFYWQGYDQFLESLKPLKTENSERFFASECMVDSFIANIDAFLSIVPPLDDLVPFFSAVYGEYTTMLGRHTPERILRDLQLFAMTQGEQLLFGGLVGWINSSILDYPDAAEYLKKLAVLRGKIREYLNYGVMLRPLNLDISGGKLEVTIPKTVTFHKLDIEIRRPAVLNTVWDLQDGRQLVLMLNEDSQERTATIPASFLAGNSIDAVFAFDKESAVDIQAGTIKMNPFAVIGVSLSQKTAGKAVTAPLPVPAQ